MTGEKMIETAVNDAMITGGFIGALIMVFLFIFSAMIATTLKRKEDRIYKLENDILILKQFKSRVEMDERMSNFEKTGAN